MKLMIVRLSSFILLVPLLTILNAQTIIPTAGGNANGNGGSVSYSVGQISYKTFTGTNGIVSQGIQQAFEISVVSTKDETNTIKLIYSIYPNPSKSHLTLNIEGVLESQFDVFLYDINGKLLENKKTEGPQTYISLEKYIAATYYLKVVNNKSILKIFKIIKN